METKVLATLPTRIPTFAEFLSERENSRHVPSPLKATTTDYSWPSLYGNPPLSDFNKDAFQYIHRIYCRECRDQEQMAAANQSNSLRQAGGSQPNSPPQYQMDQRSLAAAMDANKEALNRKLMMRRSVNELVDRGIYPSLKTPAAFAVERLHLERAQTGDKLKHKIQTRPDRQFLVQHHILEDSNIDPSLQSTQRKLKKAKLTDELNEKIANRPGPLELVEQHILEAEEPIKDAIKEGKLEYHKTQEGVDPAAIPKLPYEIESPKSGTCSPEPIDCDNDSNSSSAASTGFNPVPSPPDIAPLLKSTQHITIGGQTLEIPITTQSFAAAGSLPTVTVAAQQFTSTPHILTQQQRPSSFGATRLNRKLNKQNRPKQQQKQRTIKFHEYKGPSMSKSNSSNCSSGSSSGTFVTTTGPLQKLDGLTPYQVRVQQQQLYLQCQLEVQSKGSMPTVFVPIQQPSTPAVKQNAQEPSPPRQMETSRSRPVTPSLKSPPPPSTPQTPLHISRSLSNLEDMKVADLKLELKQRNLPVSGSKPQLIERLRSHQLQEMSSSVPSVGGYSDISSYSNIPSVQSFSDESIMAPPSVASSAGRLNSPPISPRDDLMKPPASVLSRQSEMDIDDVSQGVKTSADMVIREQAKKIEELQRALSLMQSQTQIQLVQQPFMVAPSPAPAVPKQVERKLATSQPVNQPSVSEQPPVDITDKQVFLATPDGKMTAYKVVLHTGNGFIPSMLPRAEQQPAVSNTNNTIMSEPIQSPQTVTVNDSSQTNNLPQSKIQLVDNDNTEASTEFDDVLEVLMRTGEMDPQQLIGEEKEKLICTDTNQLTSAGSCFQNPNTTDANNMETNSSNINDLPLHEPLSPLVDMDWMENDNNNHHYLDDTDGNVRSDISAQDLTFTDTGNLDWLSDVMHLDSESMPVIGTSTSNAVLSFNTSTFSTADPVLTPKAPDVLNIFNIDESDFRPPTDAGSGINWDKLIGHSSHHL